VITSAAPSLPEGGPDESQEPRLLHVLSLPVLYYLSARIGVVLSVMPEGMAILWPPNGVLLAYFIRFGPRYYWTFGLLAILAELAVDIPKYRAIDAFFFGLINVVEVTVAAHLLARSRFNPRFYDVSDLAKFVIGGPVAGAFVGAVFGAIIFSRIPGSDTPYLQFLRIWWFGDALGLMIVTPLLLGAWTRGVQQRWPELGAADAAVIAGAAGVLIVLLAARDGMLMGIHVGPTLLLPFAIAAGVRFGPSAASWVVSGITLLILVLTTQGRNPFGRDAPADAVVHAQEFMFVLSAMTLGLAALTSSLRASQSQLEEANAELRRRADALDESRRATEQAKAEVVALNAVLEQRVRERTRDLEAALSDVKQLRGLLPICAWCKRVRDGQDYWHSVEEYIAARTDAQFSHGICPDCLKELNPRQS
jgi:integral membrane sensor domain MASE1